jgi:hypothetical protein
MEAKNLRIGNYIESNGEIHEVFELDWDADRCRVNYIGDNNYNPLAISKERLIKYGFEKDDDNMLFIEIPNQVDGKLIFYFSEALGVVYLYDEENDVDINSYKYEHELQNLFFALSGKELELKE